MPLWLRRFTWQKLKEHYDAIEEANKQASQQQGSSTQVMDENGMVVAPEFLKRPTYK